MARPKTVLEKAVVDRVVTAYTQGAGLEVVADLAGVGLGAVRTVLVNAGVAIRGRGRPAKAV